MRYSFYLLEICSFRSFGALFWESPWRSRWIAGKFNYFWMHKYSVNSFIELISGLLKTAFFQQK